MNKYCGLLLFHLSAVPVINSVVWIMILKKIINYEVLLNEKYANVFFV